MGREFSLVFGYVPTEIPRREAWTWLYLQHVGATGDSAHRREPDTTDGISVRIESITWT